MRASRGRILVIRGGAIGDFILTLPALSAVRRQFPGAHIEIMGYPHIVQLAVAGGLADDARNIDARPLAGFFARGGDLSDELADYFFNFDIIVSYLYDPDRIFQSNIARCSAAQFIVAPHRPDEEAGLPAAEVFLKPLERLAVFGADPVPRLTLSSAAGAPAARTQLALHPGSGAESKNWPEANWAEFVAKLLKSTDLDLLLVGGEAEGNRLERLARRAQQVPGRLAVARSLPLLELARLLQGCAAFIGHDSGISHLAAALGLPGIVLWGNTRMNVWRPPSDKVFILCHPAGLASLAVEQVLAELERRLDTTQTALNE